MSDVPHEVQALHLRLFEKYLDVLIDRLAVHPLAADRVIWYSDRIERLLGIGELDTRTGYAYLTSHDYDALAEFRSLVRDMLGDPTSNDEDMEEGPRDKPPAAVPESESVLQDVSPIAGRSVEGDKELQQDPDPRPAKHVHRWILPSTTNNGSYEGRCSCGAVKEHQPFVKATL